MFRDTTLTDQPEFHPIPHGLRCHDLREEQTDQARHHEDQGEGEHDQRIGTEG